MVAKFTHISRLAFRTLLTNKLGEDVNTFRTEIELNNIINEALLTFGAAAMNWKDSVELTIDNTKQFYDLTTDLTINQPLLANTLTYQFLLDRINSILFENISVLDPTSDIISLDEILKFAKNRINQYQLETGLMLTRQLINMPAAPINKITIDDKLIDIIRIAFKDTADTNKFYKLREEDEGSLGYNQRSVFNSLAKIPQFYTTALGTLNEISLYPAPANNSELDIISINGLKESDVITLSTVIKLPNNLVPYILYGVLADIFAKDGIGNDVNRQNYCEERWSEGLVIGKNYTSILIGYINGNPIPLDSITSLDNNDYNWQNKTGKPNIIGIGGYNLIIANKIPNTLYSLLFYAVTNAYLPVDDDDFIDIKLEYLEPILNYCVHLAFIKDGIVAINKTKTLKDNFLKVAISNNIRLMKRGQSIESLFRKTKLEESDNSVRMSEEAAA